jgi:hypothetical protein
MSRYCFASLLEAKLETVNISEVVVKQEIQVRYSSLCYD